MAQPGRSRVQVLTYLVILFAFSSFFYFLILHSGSLGNGRGMYTLGLMYCPGLAGMLTLRYKDTLVYKNGGSDSRFHNLGAMHLLYWESIRDAKHLGLRTFDLGRTDVEQTGLIKFKSRWGAEQSTLTYTRFATKGHSQHIFDQNGSAWKMRLLKHAFAVAPRRLLPALGGFLYKHAG